MEDKATKKVEISYKTIVFTIAFGISLWLLFTVREVILGLFVAMLIMATINPTVNKLAARRIPRALAVLLVYLCIIALVGLVVGTIVPVLVDQTSAFIANVPQLVEATKYTPFGDQLENEILSQLGSLPGQIAKAAISVFSNILEVLSVLILSFYLLLARNKLDDQVSVLFGDKRKTEVRRLIDALEVKLGGWARGQLLLMLIIGTTTFVGLTLIGLPYALPLAIFAGILEIVPTIGPIIAGIPPAIIGFGLSPVIGLSTIALSFIIQQLENYLIVPKVMQTSAGVSPIATLLSLAVGFKLAGIVGALISVPIFITLQFFVREYLKQK